MRQRRIKNLFEKIEKYSDVIVSDASATKGKWNQAFGNDNPVFAEIGSGKGRFVKEMAELNPEVNFVAIEGQVKVVYHLLKTVHGYILQNAKAENLKMNVFTGPVFRDDDMIYRKKYQIPAEFWKVEGSAPSSLEWRSL